MRRPRWEAPVQLTITHNFPEVQRALDRLHGAIRDQVLASTVNKTLDKARTQMTREITREFNVKSAYVRERLRIRRASGKGLITVEGALIGGRPGRRSANIIAFVEKTPTLAERRQREKGGTGRMLYVKVKRTGPKKPLPRAFIGNRGRTVFQRVGKERLPIEPVQVIDVGQMFNTRRINGAVVRAMKADFPVIFAREARFFTERFNRGGSGR